MSLKYLLPIWKNEEKQGVAAYSFAMELAPSILEDFLSASQSGLEKQALNASLAGKPWPADPEMPLRLGRAFRAACLMAACRCSAKSPKQLAAYAGQCS
jgi:hypothetical protein